MDTRACAGADGEGILAAMTTSLLADAFGHHVWATLRIIDACEALSPEQLGTNVPGTYGSILDTLRHLIGSDAGYLAFLTGDPSLMVDEETFQPSDCRRIMERDGAAWTALLATELDPEEPMIRHRDDGTTFQAPRGVRLAQVIHHGTDHRSQICTALTSIGIEPPELDVWDYAASDGRAFETAPA